jgi:putative ABC transport system permease protein
VYEYTREHDWSHLSLVARTSAAALAAGRLMARLVFGVSASDPMTFVAVAATLVFVALMASLVPAYRASRLDPSEVLRAM